MRELLDAHKLEDILLRLLSAKGRLFFAFHLVEIAHKSASPNGLSDAQMLPAADAAACMDRVFQNVDVIAQLDTNKFAIVQLRPDSEAHLSEMSMDLCSDLSALAHCGHGEVTCFAGTVEFAETFSSPFQLLQRAQLALTKQVRKGVAGQTTDDSVFLASPHSECSVTKALGDAIEHDQFELFYQPIVKSKSRTIAQYEALIRWRQQANTYIPPLQFIPAAERTGVIVEIGRWVLERACRQILAHDGCVGVAVNISPSEFLTSDVSASVEHALEETGLHPRRLTIELTENVFMSFSEPIIQQFERIAGMGVSLSIDDFGMGFSSLARIHALPIKSIKIDRSLVAPIEHSSRSRKVVKSIVKMATDLNLISVAEGVETQRQADLLGEAGATLLQGYFFGPPLPLQMGSETRQLLGSAAC